jgi:hypothetical protein
MKKITKPVLFSCFSLFLVQIANVAVADLSSDQQSELDSVVTQAVKGVEVITEVKKFREETGVDLGTGAGTAQFDEEFLEDLFGPTSR